MNPKTILKNVLPPVVLNGLVKVAGKLGYPPVAPAPARIKYRIKDLDIVLDGDHALPRIQKAHPLYDQFLPFLLSRIPAGWVIDVGANVGDTLYALIQSSDCQFLCVEPDDVYFPLLRENVARLSKSQQDRVLLENAFVSSRSDARTTRRAGGTATAVTVDSHGPTARSVSLSELVRERQIPPSEVVLVKVDTDGYDTDCLLSIGESWKEMSPLLYWEHWFEKKEQCEELPKLFELLASNGYEYFALFDSAGVPMCRGGMQVLRDHHDFLVGVHKGLTTIASNYYMDVLACKPYQRAIVDTVVDAFKTAYATTSL